MAWGSRSNEAPAMPTFKNVGNRTVFPSREVPHLWAHKATSRARAAGAHIYFEGDTIYSYGSHFPVARHVTHKGKAAVFFTSRYASVTTQCHKGKIRRAIPASVAVFETAEVFSKPADVLREYRNRIDNELIELGAANRRNYAKHFEKATELVAQFNRFAEFFGYKARFELSADVIAEGKRAAERKRQEQAARNKRLAQQAALAEKLAAEKRAEWAAKVPGIIDRWHNGESFDTTLDTIPGRYSDMVPTLLRIVGDNVETSRGAEFPVAHAYRVLRLVERLLVAGETYQRNGHTIHLGPYALDRIDAEGTIFAGCHVVPKAEALRLIELLKARHVLPAAAV